MTRTETLQPIPTLKNFGTIFEPTPLVEVKEENKNLEKLLSKESEFSEIKDPQIQVALRLLDTNAMANLSFDQKKTLLVYYIWHYSPEKKIKEQIIIPRKTTLHAIDSVVNKSNNLISRYERLDGLASMVQRIEEETKKTPSINEFDYWVFQIWSTTAEYLKTLINHIPSEFGLNEVTSSKKRHRIRESLRKLKKYQQINAGFKKRRVQLRQAKIVEIFTEKDSVSHKKLSQIIQADEETIRKDLVSLRKKKVISKGRQLRNESEKNFLLEQVKKVIIDLEAEGRSYKKGEIGSAEIAHTLKMDLNYIRHFIFINKTLLDLPQKENPLLVKLIKQNKCKEKMRPLLKSNSNLSAKQILQLLSGSGLEVNYMPGTIKAFKREILAEIKE